MNFPIERAVPVLFRIWALGSRFLLIFFLARYLTPAEVGLYGLVAAITTYAIYVLGFDMYTFTTRQIIASDSGTWRLKVNSHFTFLVVVAVIVLPVLLMVFVSDVLPWSVILWFYLIVVTEHLSVEIDRLLVAMANQFGASLVILVRQALLPTLMIPMMIFTPASRDLHWVFAGWAFFNLAAILLGATYIRWILRGVGQAEVDWTWLRRGLIAALPLLAGTLSLRVIFTLDRQLVVLFSDLETLGAYTLAMTVAGGLSSLVAVGIHQFSYPKLVRFASERDIPNLLKGIRGLWIQTAVAVVLVLLTVLLGLQTLLGWYDEPIYKEYAWAVPAGVAVIGVFNFSLVPHLALYALHKDKAILYSTLVATAGFIVWVFSAASLGGDAVVVVLTGVLLASVWLLSSKYVVYRRSLAAMRD